MTTGYRVRGSPSRSTPGGPSQRSAPSASRLAAEAKASSTVRTCTDAVRWFAAAHLIPCTGDQTWDEVRGQYVQRWIVWLLGRYSDAYASNQFRALQQFFRWWAEGRTA